jgi:hypothetical protein
MEEQSEIQKMLEKRARADQLKSGLDKLQIELINLKKMSLKYFENSVERALHGIEFYNKFLEYYKSYKQLSQHAKELGFIEEDFEEKHENLYYRGYAIIRVPERYAVLQRLDDADLPEHAEEGKIFYRIQPNNPAQYLTYKVIDPKGNEIVDFISKDEIKKLAKRKGNTTISEADMRKITLERGHTARNWSDSPYFLEFQEKFQEFNLQRLPEINQIADVLNKAKQSAYRKTENYYLVGAVLTGLTIIGGLITLIAYAIDNYFTKKEIQQLEEEKSDLMAEYSKDKATLESTENIKNPIKQEVYHHLREINLLFKPFKERAIKGAEQKESEEQPHKPHKPFDSK